MNNSTINLILNFLIVIVFVAIVFLSMGSTRDIENFFNEITYVPMGNGDVDIQCDTICQRPEIAKLYKDLSNNGLIYRGSRIHFNEAFNIPLEYSLLARDKKQDPTKHYYLLPVTDNKILD